MNYRNERFNAQMLSLDALDPETLAKSETYSDHGAAVEALLARDEDNPTSREEALTEDAFILAQAMCLEARGLGHLIPVLRLIARNGCDAAASIETLRRRNHSTKAAATRLYQLHRHQLMEIFISPNK